MKGVVVWKIMIDVYFYCIVYVLMQGVPVDLYADQMGNRIKERLALGGWHE
jgi:hypothetical protein